MILMTRFPLFPKSFWRVSFVPALNEAIACRVAQGACGPCAAAEPPATRAATGAEGGTAASHCSGGGAGGAKEL